MTGRRARAADVHGPALGMPHVKEVTGRAEHPAYQVGGKSFVFFRTPRPESVGEHSPDGGATRP